MCSHIRKSPVHWLCAPTRSLSQLITSFIGSWCQGIHHAPFVAWPIQSKIFKVLHLISQRIFLGLLLNMFWSYILIHVQFSKNKLVGLNGLEPSTSRLSGVRSNQLSYRPIVVEVKGVEPLTPCVQGKCSPNWAIPPQVIEQSNDRSKLNRN